MIAKAKIHPFPDFDHGSCLRNVTFPFSDLFTFRWGKSASRRRPKSYVFEACYLTIEQLHVDKYLCCSPEFMLSKSEFSHPTIVSLVDLEKPLPCELADIAARFCSVKYGNQGLVMISPLTFSPQHSLGHLRANIAEHFEVDILMGSAEEYRGRYLPNFLERNFGAHAGFEGMLC